MPTRESTPPEHPDWESVASRLTAALVDLVAVIHADGRSSQTILPDGPPKLLLSVQEAAQALGIGRDRVYGMVRTGELRSVCVGQTWKIPTAELKRWIASRTPPQQPAGGRRIA